MAYRTRGHYTACGCYYLRANYDPLYLPVVKTSVHSKILATASHTTLRQTFRNPNASHKIEKCRYAFPLFDGVSVAGFECHIGSSRTLHGVVHERQEARDIYDSAVSRGETAGLLDQSVEAADVFVASLGNIAPGETVVVEITYVGELKNDVEADGTRFTIPTFIAPRYGKHSGTSLAEGGLPVAVDAEGGGIEITIDVQMPADLPIRSIQSPSHPISVSMGILSTDVPPVPALNKASATLALGEAALDKDFVLIVQSTDGGNPRAVLETHPTLPNQRALMTTLVPKFALPLKSPEIIFVADRSGSMQGNIPMLIAAMKVFLKSLPANCKFNICSFGSHHSFLWPTSQFYSKTTSEAANQHVATFAANFGGTETLAAIRASIEQRTEHMPLEIILLTDGDIWSQEDAFAYVSEKVRESDGMIRLFPLGIGNGVSHSLIEGLARSGNGFAQAVQQGERVDGRVVRMLRGALSPHVSDYRLEVKYEGGGGSGGEAARSGVGNGDIAMVVDDGEEGHDDFELVERVTDGMRVLLTQSDDSVANAAAAVDKQRGKKIALFDATVDTEAEKINKTIADLPLPEIPRPKLLQAPHNIPSLFSFTRTTVYLLMSPDSEAAKKTPISVTLRATSEQGELELEIPVEVLREKGETIHRLAARKATQDYEEHRGWIFDATEELPETATGGGDGKLIKDKFAPVFDELVKREAVHLGTRFQVANRWCSFVAVAANSKEEAVRKKNQDNKKKKNREANNNDSDKRSSSPMDAAGSADYEMGTAKDCEDDEEEETYSDSSYASDAELCAAGCADTPTRKKEAYSPWGNSRTGGPGGLKALAEPSEAKYKAAGPTKMSASAAFARGGADEGSGPRPAGGARGGYRGSRGRGGGGGGGGRGPGFGSRSGFFSSSSGGGGSRSAGGTNFRYSAHAPMAPPPPGGPGYQPNSAIAQSSSAATSLRSGGGPPPARMMAMQCQQQAAGPAVPWPSAPPATLRIRAAAAAPAAPSPSPSSSTSKGAVPLTDEARVHRLIELQDFDGFWTASEELWGLLGGNDGKNTTNIAMMKNAPPQALNAVTSGTYSKGAGGSERAWPTALVLAFLEIRMPQERGVWELVADKAIAWLGTVIKGQEMEQLRDAAKGGFFSS